MQSEAQLLRQFLTDLANSKASEHLDNITEDCEIHVCLGNQMFTDSYSATFVGKAGVMNFIQAWNKFLDEVNISFEEFVSEKGKVVARGELKCHLKLSEHYWSASWMQICSFNNGKILKLRIFSDFQPTILSSNLDPVAKGDIGEENIHPIHRH